MSARYLRFAILLCLLPSLFAEKKPAKSAKGCCSAAAQATAEPSGTLTLNGGAVNVILSADNNTAFACGASQISIVDISDPASLRLISTVGSADFGGLAIAGCFQVAQSLVVPVNTQSGFVYDVSSPRNVQRQSRFSPAFPFNGYVSFLGNTGFFTTDWFRYNTGPNTIFEQHGDFAAMDFSDPANPKPAGTLSPEASQPGSANLSPRFSSVNISSDTTYILATTSTGGDTNGGQGAIQIIDVSNPAAMAGKGLVIVPQATIMTAGVVKDNILIATGNSKSWRNPGTRNNSLNFQFTGILTLSAFDVSDPRNPVLLSTRCTDLTTGSLITSAIVPLDNGFYALAVSPPSDDAIAFGADARGQLMLIDARDPANMGLISLGFVPKLAGITARGGILYAATGDGLLRFTLPDTSSF